jgi:hypothetical protein
MPGLIFDASSLIAATRFEVGKQPIIDYILNDLKVVIPEEVKVEVVDQGLVRGYSDAVLLDQRVKAAAIEVTASKTTHPILETILHEYGLEDGDRAIVRICREISDYEWVVVDDRLLYIVLNRFGLRPSFLPDVIEWLVTENKWKQSLAESVLQTIRPRYRSGFITHSLERLNGRV